jgi:hypothetical protein
LQLLETLITGFQFDCGRATLRSASLLQHMRTPMMASNKTATLTLRLDPTLKEALRNAAEQEHRSLANMVEVMILDYCSRHGHAVPNAVEETKRGEQSK